MVNVLDDGQILQEGIEELASKLNVFSYMNEDEYFLLFNTTSVFQGASLSSVRASHHFSGNLHRAIATV